MTPLVLDASVAAKWLLPATTEPLADRALALLGRQAEGAVGFVVPDLFWAEIGNVLWKAIRQARLSLSAAEESLETAQRWAFPTISSERFLGEALQIAHRHSRTLYESIYLALAVSEQIELVTADEHLSNAVGAKLPVKWLGDL